jgi:hypothetical protein
LKKDTAKMHCNNVIFNVLDNAPLAVYQVALVGHLLVMGLKIDSSSIDAWLSKMEVAIENIVSFVVVSNLVVNQLMESGVAVAIIAKVASTKQAKWTTVMAENMC